MLRDGPSIILDNVLGRCVYLRDDTCTCDIFSERKIYGLVRHCALIRLDEDHNIQWDGILECYRRVDAVSIRSFRLLAPGYALILDKIT